MRLVPSCHYLVFGVSGEMAAGEELLLLLLLFHVGFERNALHGVFLSGDLLRFFWR